MFFKKKEAGDENLRRRFHHSLLQKRRSDSLAKTLLPARNRRAPLRKPPSAFFAAFKKVAILVGIVLLLIGGFYLVFFSAFFVVTKVTLEKTGTALSATQMSPFLDKLKGKNLLFVNPNAITREMEQTFAHEVLLVKIRKSPPSTLIVHVEEHPAVLNVRVTAGDLPQPQKFVINKTGYIIAENTEQKSLPLLTITLPKPITGRTVLINPERLDPIVDAFTKFPEIFGIKIVSGEWEKVERELHIRTEKNFDVWLDLTASIDDQLAKLKRALPKLDIYHEPLEYIDLRIPGGDSERVIFKRKK